MDEAFLLLHAPTLHTCSASMTVSIIWEEKSDSDYFFVIYFSFVSVSLSIMVGWVYSLIPHCPWSGNDNDNGSTVAGSRNTTCLGQLSQTVLKFFISFLIFNFFFLNLHAYSIFTY